MLIDASVADGVAYEDELPERLEVDPKKGIVEGERYLRFFEAKLFRPIRRRPYIAVVPVKGAISESGSPQGRRASIVAALRQARRDRRALVLGALLIGSAWFLLRAVRRSPEPALTVCEPPDQGRADYQDRHCQCGRWRDAPGPGFRIAWRRGGCSRSTRGRSERGDQ